MKKLILAMLICGNVIAGNHTGQDITFKVAYSNGYSQATWESDYTGETLFAGWIYTNATYYWPSSATNWDGAIWFEDGTNYIYEVLVTNVNDFANCEKWFQWYQWYPYDWFTNETTTLSVEPFVFKN